MEARNFRPELHVAQQSRRDKLRVQNHQNLDQNGEVYTNHSEHFTGHVGLNQDPIQLQSVRYGNLSCEAPVFSSEMFNFATNSQASLAHRDVSMVHQMSSCSQPGNRIAAEVSGDPQNCGAWKSIGSHETCDWATSYTSGSAGIDSISNPIFAAEGLSGSMKQNHSSASAFYLKPNCYGYQEMRSPLTGQSSEIASRNSQKHYGEMHFNSPSIYHNSTFQEVTSPTIVTQELGIASLAQENVRKTGQVSWANSGNELLLLPAYTDQANPLRLSSACDGISRQVDGYHDQWSGELDFPENKNASKNLRTIANDKSNTQALSLSLSSVPLTKQNAYQAGERILSEDLHSEGGCYNNIQDMKALKSDYVLAIAKPSSTGKFLESIDMVGNSSFAHRGAGPLGPFTGYATILKSSKFLNPAKQLLDEFCNVAGPKPLKMIEAPNKVSMDIRSSCDAVNATESVAGALAGDSGGSSSTFYSSNEKIQEAGGLTSPNESGRPEYLQKKAKLLYMHEEVCRRYKNYHQQMQMVVSSFESVAGLSATTPYISLALRNVSKHFRCLRNAITDQIKYVRRALGEDLSSLTTGTSSSKGDTSSSRLKLIDQSLPKQKAVGGNLGFFEPQQHVWRPQRGLPERAVAILRAWLFDHFLHPYPTDADKHMLATQTGLTRNQVSNWFINARVRVWKPMVEEIHLLETKGVAETGSTAGKTEGKTATEVGGSRSNDGQLLNRLSASGLSGKRVEFSEIGSSPLPLAGNRTNAETWNQEKRSRVECRIPSSMDGSFVGFVPYQQSGIDIGGLGAVSLTLGLRQNADGVQQQQHENQLRPHFGDQIIYDFVG